MVVRTTVHNLVLSLKVSSGSWDTRSNFRLHSPRSFGFITVTMVVLDEADEMPKMGFKEDLEAILDETPDEKQVLLFQQPCPGIGVLPSVRWLIPIG